MFSITFCTSHLSGSSTVVTAIAVVWHTLRQANIIDIATIIARSDCSNSISHNSERMSFHPRGREKYSIHNRQLGMCEIVRTGVRDWREQFAEGSESGKERSGGPGSIAK